MRSIGKVMVGAIVLSGLVGINACASGPDSQTAGELGEVDTTEQDLRRRTPCASSDDCREDQFCTTEIGDCRRPPGCRPGDICPAVCYGVCRPRPAECRRDTDCRTFSDYCTGCDCRALASNEPDPVCPGPGVQCLIDPCFNQRAVCSRGQCALVEQ